MDRIVLGRDYGFDSWLLDAFTEVCERFDSLSLQEASRMSVDDIVRIGQAREAIRLPIFPLNIAQIRVIVSRIFVLRDGGSGSEGSKTSEFAHWSRQAQPNQEIGGSATSTFVNGDKSLIGGMQAV